MTAFTSGQQVYIHKGRLYRRHAKFLEELPLQKGFCLVRIYDRRGEITNNYDVIPMAHIRPVVEHAADA